MRHFDPSDWALSPEDGVDADAVADAGVNGALTPPRATRTSVSPVSPGSAAVPPPAAAVMAIVQPKKPIEVLRELSRDALPAPSRHEASVGGRDRSLDRQLASSDPYTPGGESLRELRTTVARHEVTLEVQHRAIAELVSTVEQLLLGHARGDLMVSPPFGSPVFSPGSLARLPESTHAVSTRTADSGSAGRRPTNVATTPRSAGGFGLAVRFKFKSG
ncbi:hypothetical protein T492DRAFT_228127 [Pavlovales sp. CCMP2436]|nr:hypothetical protein T492DRAFT_228127 [Pavlovales sp. CCMP2436]